MSWGRSVQLGYRYHSIISVVILYGPHIWICKMSEKPLDGTHGLKRPTPTLKLAGLLREAKQEARQ